MVTKKDRRDSCRKIISSKDPINFPGEYYYWNGWNDYSYGGGPYLIDRTRIKMVSEASRYKIPEYHSYHRRRYKKTYTWDADGTWKVAREWEDKTYGFYYDFDDIYIKLHENNNKLKKMLKRRKAMQAKEKMKNGNKFICAFGQKEYKFIHNE